MAYDAYLSTRQAKKLASGDGVKVRVDGEYIWISGRDVRNQL